MKNLIITFVLILLTFSCKKVDKSDQINLAQNQIELMELQKWFDAWELVSTEMLNLKVPSPPIMIFFDDTYVYTNSNLVIKYGYKFKGPKFFKKDINWIKGKHNDTLTLPNGDRIPVSLMSFAGSFEYKNKNTPFFVMGTPIFWKNNNIKSIELGDENLYTSIFLHEFAHTQQTQNFGKRLDHFEKLYAFKNNLNDDMIQMVFQQDPEYVSSIQNEIETFYSAYATTNEKNLIRLTREGLSQYNNRQQKYFTKEAIIYKEIDDFFLTMEGIGQYISFSWLTHPNGANIDKITAINGVRRNKSWWSQDESLALFLIYSKLTTVEQIGKEMFNIESKSIVDLLNDKLN